MITNLGEGLAGLPYLGVDMESFGSTRKGNYASLERVIVPPRKGNCASAASPSLISAIG